MSARSSPTQYGVVPIIVHWLTAILVITTIVLGFLSASSADDGFRKLVLSFHLPIGLAILALTVFRIGWWVFADRYPADPLGTPPMQARIVLWSHIGFYVLLMLMTLSGIGLVALSDAADVIFADGSAALPDFSDYAPMIGHGLGALLITALVVVHIGAVIYHQMVRKDGLIHRMLPGAPE